MIIEVVIRGEDEPRRYHVVRNNGDIRLRRLGDDTETDGEAMRVDWRIPESHVYSLLIDGRSYDVHIDAGDDEEQLEIHLLSHVVEATASDARKRRIARATDGPAGPVQVTAPMPGRIVTVLAAQGTEVSRGDGIIVLEAMKMENELKAPRDGTVVAVHVEEGQGVEGGVLLATIE